MHGAEEPSREQRVLPGKARERAIAVRQLGKRLAVGAPGGISQEGEVLKVSERLERFHTLPASVGQLDCAACEAIALLDREPAMRVRRAGEQVGARPPPKVVVAQEREGLFVVVREQFRQLVGSLAAPLLDPRRRLRVGAVLSLRSWQARVGHVADEHMLEHVLRLAGDRGRRPLEHELAAAQRLKRGVEIVDLHEAAQGAVPEDPPDHRRALRDALLVRCQQVEPRKDDGLDVVRDLDVLDTGSSPPPLARPDELPVVDQVPDDLLEEERVTPWSARGSGDARRRASRRCPEETRPAAHSRRR